MSNVSLSATANQIVTMYEDGYGAEEIAEMLGDLDVTVVKTVLLQNCPIYKQRLKRNEETFDEMQYDAARMAMFQLVQAEDEATRFRASKFIIDEAKGRNDVKARLNGIAALGNINANIFNEYMNKARAAINKAKGMKVIDVKSEV